MTKIIEVCKLVGIHSYIDSLPNKYDSIIGKNGTNLSGGQKSRLLIARALLKNPKIMLFDEITSELDAQSEIDIMEILKNLSKNHTILMVAHRINAILAAQKIIVMESGNLVGFDDHHNLILNCKSYIDLFSEQINDLGKKIL
ncbi:multidrug resistance ABC transporter ATP-binding and permease [Clostridium botulinum B str. Osaka05]|uniref:Multidrug resistance ABC transporter ATP-binding and permease n=2 Tax=Clostridium botulinum TaxID=1491 RepID=A0A0S6TZX4_CLOBO|nr:multidrug resistance ABC transporter ATP-binding and permease [Clostridium botulinum B str. Osaka05]